MYKKSMKPYGKCNFEDCNIQARFNNPNEKKGMFCTTHKQNGMVNVIDKKCIYDNCSKQPSYNLPNLKKPLYCYDHKLENMINIKDKKCVVEGCNIIPSFSSDGKTKEYCGKHKKEGMTNLVNIKCVNDACKKLAGYNFEGMRPLYCSQHKLVNMIDVKHNKCLENKCKTRPTFNYKGKPPLYCYAHKKDNMVNVVNKICKMELCDTTVTGKYEGYCRRCFIYLHPDNIISRCYKQKELEVAKFIKTVFPDITIYCDKKVSLGCSSRRPDIFIDLGHQVLIIEIDENQHIGYDCSCENKRLMELSQDINHRPLVFIRFNPDSYIDKNGRKVSSCWYKTAYNTILVHSTKKEEWNTRLKTLKETCDYWMNNTTDKTIEVIELFYDNR